MLTYARLLRSLHTLYPIINQSFPERKNKERRRLMHIAVDSAIISSEEGLNGSDEVLSPGQMKHWLQRKFAEIHESVEEEEEKAPASSQKRKNTASSARNKRYRSQKTDVSQDTQDVADALLALARQDTTGTTQRILDHGRSTYTAFPAVYGVRNAFLTGAQYALENMGSAGSGACVFSSPAFCEYVRAELGLAMAEEGEVAVEDTEGGEGDVEATRAAGQLAGMAMAERGGMGDGAVGGGASRPVGRFGNKGFWDVI
ncbi:glycoside hydrolase family 67 [Pyrenophora seminiperda CCB06]|uniref:Glycoside hydrolase family 67 n=1 Tax=Pyrenophora seminiperda CCB06 TaxID=1302712 RepID=A0A3M7M893_9PLEO|nr:glycoside hydrolase family 67 [Pyrenophora seminiperda CCB06]